jgi:mevalonate kinase
MQEIRVAGKWILLGEHAVVRGGSAIVFPLLSKFFHLRIEEKAPASAWTLTFSPTTPPELASAFMQALQVGEKFLDGKLPTASYRIHLESNLVVSAGLGSSATICVALARWLSEMGVLATSKIFTVAREMENHFHGRSSGLDIAAVYEGKALEFHKDRGATVLSTKWQPKIYLMDTGLRSSTADCVKKVSAMNRPDLDEKMQRAVTMAKAALQADSGLNDLAKAIALGEECFLEWGLIPESVRQQISQLKAAGALAVKPTGSGNGGFLLSLWDQAPPAALSPTLIPSR